MKKLLFILLLLVGSASQSWGQDIIDVNARVKALYIYNFAKSMDWPDSYKKGNFVIGVIGNKDVHAKLVELYSSKSIGSQPIEIRRFEDASEIKGCHILFVADSKSKELGTIIKDQSGTSTLIVTESKTGLAQGAVISFMFIQGKLKYSLSTKNAKKIKIVVGDNLVKWAETVEN